MALPLTHEQRMMWRRLTPGERKLWREIRGTSKLSLRQKQAAARLRVTLYTRVCFCGMQFMGRDDDQAMEKLRAHFVWHHEYQVERRERNFRRSA
ncbi:MAG: hypothetical protein WA197_18440 [Candidatus Acidiferrales bacterium]